MNLLTLEEAKTMMGVTHSFDDQRIQHLINGAGADALSFMNRERDAQWDDQDGLVNPPDDVKSAVCLLVQAGYEGSVDDMAKVQSLVESKLFKYRKGLGV